MKDELLIERKFGRRIPFKVPADYFEQLTDSVMQNTEGIIPMQAEHPVRTLRPLRWAACAATAAVVFAAAWYGLKGEKPQQPAETSVATVSSSNYDDYTIDEVSDFAMLDNDDFYSYLNGE